MDWSYFQGAGADSFRLKRLPTITKPFRITDRTDFSDYRDEFKNVSLREGIARYQRYFSDDYSFEIEVEETEEFLAKLNPNILGPLHPFKSDPDSLLTLYEAFGEEDSVMLDKKLADYSLKAGLVSVDPEEDGWYFPTTILDREMRRLALDLVHSLEEQLKNYPAPYQQCVIRTVADELEPGGLFEQAISESDKSSAMRIRSAATADEFGRVRVWPKRNSTPRKPEKESGMIRQRAGRGWFIVLAICAAAALFVVALST